MVTVRQQLGLRNKHQTSQTTHALRATDRACGSKKRDAKVFACGKEETKTAGEEGNEEDGEVQRRTG